MADLDEEGKSAADQLLTMMGDMQFQKDSVWGTYARYVLLVDTSFFLRLCFLAQINGEQLRAHLWSCERGENSASGRNVDQAELPFTVIKNANLLF